MSFLDRLFGRPVYVQRGGVAATAVLGKSPADLYREQPEVRAVVSFIQDAVASTPLKVYKRVDENDRQRDRTSVAARLLASPSDGVTTFESISRLVGDLCLYGACLWHVAPNVQRDAGWTITYIPYAWVQDVYTLDGFTPSAYVVQNPVSGLAPVTIPASDTVRFAAYNPTGGVEAVSPIDSLKSILAERVSALDFRNKNWRNGGWVNRWISRPAGAVWDDQQRQRFAASWRARFAGSEGTDSGGTPILEDGMQLHDSTFNAREAQFAEVTQLTREDVCAAYHLNPSLIYHTSTQTYASAKDNARALYSETLTPLMDLIVERINKVLLPMLGVDADTYVEFDLSAKVSASFEEQAQMLTSAVGAPWMLVDEARAIMNRPALGGSASKLVQPLNLAYGDEGEPSNTLNSGVSAVKSGEPHFKSHQTPNDADSELVAKQLAKFFTRQKRSVLAEITKQAKNGTLRVKADDGNDYPDWWDGKRWSKELADDLTPLFLQLSEKHAKETLKDVRLKPNSYDVERTQAYIRTMAEGKATALNNVTLRQLQEALERQNSDDNEDTDDSILANSPDGVFEKAESSRSLSAGLAFSTACAVFGSMEAVRQQAPSSVFKRYKTWVHGGSSNPRSEHLAMDGERVEMDAEFSNGSQYPHDHGMTPDESCNCTCSVEIEIWKE